MALNIFGALTKGLTDIYNQSQQPATPKPTETAYYTPDGTKNTGYNIDGKTYKDTAGQQRIDEGTYTYAGDTWWQMGKDGGVQVDQVPWISQPTVQSKTQPMTDSFNSQYSDDINNVISAINMYQGNDSMGRDEATARANSQLNGMYDAKLDKTLDNYNKDAVSRGMFGQLPIEALKQGAIADNELDKSVAINDLAGNMFTDDFNMARQEDNDFYNKQNNLLNALSRGYNIEQDTYNIKQNERQEDINTLGQYSNDFQQRINDITSDADKSNDWEAPYLNMLRQDKIAGINSANAENQSAEYNNAMKMFNSLGYASGWIADALGVPEGTTTASYANMIADNNRVSASGGSSKGTSDGTDEVETKELTLAQKQSIGDDARALLNMWYPKETVFTDQQWEDAYSYAYQFFTANPEDKILQNDIEDELMKRTMIDDIKAGTLPGLDTRNSGNIYDLSR